MDQRYRTIAKLNGEDTLRQLTHYYGFVAEILSTRSAQDLLECTVRSVLDATRAHSAVACLIDTAGNLTMFYGLDEKNNLLHTRMEYPDQLIQQVRLWGEPLVLSGDDLTETQQLGPALQEQGVVALVGLPLAREKSPAVGCLFVHYDAPHEFTPIELRWLSLYAAQAAHAAERQRFLREISQRDADLSVMVDTAHMMNSTLELGGLLQQVAIRLSWVTSTDACAILSFESEPDRVRVLAHFTALGIIVEEDSGRTYLLDHYPAIWQVLQSGNPLELHVDDPSVNQNDIEPLRHFGYGTMLLLPLRVWGQPIGAVELYCRQPDRRFTPADLKRLRLLAEQVALAMVNARHYTDEQRARLMAETLRQATAALTSTLELKQVLELILERLQQVVQSDSASLMLVEGEEYRVVAVRGHPHPEEALAVHALIREDALASEMFANKEPILIPDVKQDERFRTLGHADHVRGWMGIPLIARGEVTGFLTVDSRKESTYTPADARLALAFATQAALVVANARLYQSEREQRTLAEALREISLALSGSLKAEAILEILLEQIGRVVPYDSGCVMLVEGEKVRIASHRGFGRFGVDHLLAEFNLLLKDAVHLKKMASTGRPLFIPDIKTDPGWVHAETSRHVGSWVGAPLMARDRLMGFLSLDKVDRNYYTAEHVARLELLAGHAALALWNAITFGEVELASITDFLTGTFNHRYFQQQVRREIERAIRLDGPVSLLMIDLDSFKKVNDAYGHLCGDQVLSQLAARLKSELRSIDLLSRYGGEEFAVIMPGTPKHALERVAERLLRVVAERPFLVEGNDITVTVSIGGATFPKDAAEAPELIACADKALYQAKSDGRNCLRIAVGGCA